MAGTISRVWGALLAGCLLCAPAISRAGPFEEVEQLDTTLVRGRSTQEDVRRLLGKPDGKGAARFPPAWAEQEIWYYREQKVHASLWNPRIRDGKVEADAESRELLVLFTGGRFDGYLWYGVRVEGEDLP